MNYSFEIQKLTYDQCGVNGGRTTLPSGKEFIVEKDFNKDAFLLEALEMMKEKVNSKQYPYQFKRLAVVFLGLDGTAKMLFTDVDVWPDGHYILDIIGKDDVDVLYDFSCIGEVLLGLSIQLYNIFQQISDTKVCIPDFAIKGDISQAETYMRDSNRCLDVLGECVLTRSVELEDFNQYVRYEMGEEFYIEEYDCVATNSTEYWLCREFSKKKLLITSYDFNDDNRDGFFSDENKLFLDQQVMELVLELSDVHEYFYIDNEHRFRAAAISCLDEDCQEKHFGDNPFDCDE